MRGLYDQMSTIEPKHRAKVLEESKELFAVQKNSSKQGQSDVPDAGDDVDLHFICFIEHNGVLYELDGRKAVPINHGACTDLLNVFISSFQID